MFFGYNKMHSVTAILFDLNLPSFDTLMHYYGLLVWMLLLYILQTLVLDPFVFSVVAMIRTVFSTLGFYSFSVFLYFRGVSFSFMDILS